MKPAAPALALLSICLLSSCGTTTRHVAMAQLEARLQDDTRLQTEAGGRPWYQWSYIGSTEDHHYFRRQVGKVLSSDPRDGFYGTPREAIRLADAEFERPEPDDSTRWKQAFTQRDSHGMPVAYSTRFGVDGAPTHNNEAQQVGGAKRE
jgi:hypothetical protein